MNLNSPPSDGISSVKFSPSSNMLLVTSWDSSVQLHDAQLNQLRAKYEHKAAVLDCCLPDDTRAFSGGLDCGLKLHDFASANEETLGSHQAPIRCLEYSADTSLVVSGSWDKTVGLWDVRQKESLVKSAPQPGKVFTMSLAGTKLVVGTSGLHIPIWDLRHMDAPVEKRVSSLKYQTRAIRCFPDKTGYALGSVEGRVAIEYFDKAAQKKKYAFKCHRSTKAQVTTVYPVNALAFNPKYGTFATGGCDGIVSIWDGANKKRLCQLCKYPTGISSLAFNHDGSLLAVASSYTYEQGEKQNTTNTIHIHAVQDHQVKPKPRKA